MDVNRVYKRCNRITSAVAAALALALVPVLGNAQAESQEASEDAARTPSHPLDSLLSQELVSVVETLQASGRVSEDTRYHIINLHEPPKADVLNWAHGDSFSREAFVVLRQELRTFEAIVDLSDQDVTTWREVEGVQPNMLGEEFSGGDEVIKGHSDWQAAMRRRGITEFESVSCEPVTPGYFGIGEEEGRRMGKAVCYELSGAQNYWGRPVGGLTILFDLDRFEVIRVIDTGPVPIPSAPVDYDQASVGALREIPTPISIEQPAGPSFRVDGQEVSWQKWNLHFRIDPRVGLVVSRVRYTDGGNVRSILYQGSLSELFVPYMDPTVGWYWRTYMDAGEFLVGINAVSLEPGVDCPGSARYFDVAFANAEGTPENRPRAACLFERYAGDVAWRHYEFVTGETETRKKRDLVLRLVSAIGNYDYTFDWTFQQDGTIRVGVGASGIEQVKAVASRTANDDGGDADSAYGRFVSEHTVAINHDHFFNFRLDLDVDGTNNSFVQDNLKTVPLGAEYPRKSIWILDSQTARTEQQGKLRINLEQPALWRIINPDVTGPVGYPVSYQIKPGSNAVSLMTPEDFPQLRAGFTDYHLWVTPYQAEERYAAGAYPAQSKGGDGLPSWTNTNRSIENTDLVIWYSVGLHHVVRAEDWPVLPTNWLSFELRPFDFFERNPAIDLPAGSR